MLLINKDMKAADDMRVMTRRASLSPAARTGKIAHPIGNPGNLKPMGQDKNSHDGDDCIIVKPENTSWGLRRG